MMGNKGLKKWIGRNESALIAALRRPADLCKRSTRRTKPRAIDPESLEHMPRTNAPGFGQRRDLVFFATDTPQALSTGDLATSQTAGADLA